jgi:hypothetical protein
MSIEDRIAITENIYAYAYHWDGQDIDSFITVFTEDAVWEFIAAGASEAEVRLVGHAQMRAWGAERLGRRKGKFVSRHFQTNIVFDELGADTARTRTMVLVLHHTVGESAPVPILTGVYHDVHKRTPKGWKMSHRAVRHDHHAAHVSKT